MSGEFQVTVPSYRPNQYICFRSIVYSSMVCARRDELRCSTLIRTILQSSTVFMAKTHDVSAGQTALRFGEENTAGMSAIWSCKFSSDGNEVFAGGPGPIYGMCQAIIVGGLG